MKVISLLTLVAAAIGAAILLSSGPGTRLGMWSWQTAFAMFKWATYIGLAAGVVAIVQLAVPAWRGPNTVMLSIAVVLALIAITPPLAFLQKAKSLPYIHDITTDTDDPPAFVTLLPVREKSANGAAYGGAEVAAQQKKAYADVVPLSLATPPVQAFAKALDAARAEGWEIASADEKAGRIEATETTTWFGFKDDIVVRVRAAGSASRIDVRSVSRVGKSDVGANATRVRSYLQRLKA